MHSEYSMEFLELFRPSLMLEKQFLMCSDVPDAQCPEEALHTEISKNPVFRLIKSRKPMASCIAKSIQTGS